MNSTPLEPAALPSAPPPAPVRPGRERLRRRLGFAAIVACLPYLTLKALWVCGVGVGVVDRNKLIAGHNNWVLVNLVTFLMDGVAALIAYLLTRPGGPRVRTWLVALPMWMAAGLLSVIMLAVPLDLATTLFGAPNLFRSHDGFLEPWVYAVVYGGFIVEGVVLLGAFGMYARERHGRLLGASVASFARRVPTAARAAALVAAGLLAATAVVRLAWGCGATFGMSAVRAAEMDRTTYITQCVQAGLSLAGAAGLAVLASGRTRARVWLPLAAAWVGSAEAFGWGGMIGDLGALARDPGHPSSAFMIAVYIAETVAGFLVLGAGLWGLRAAASGTARRACPARPAELAVPE